MSGKHSGLRIGTRGSVLALWQANDVAEKIRRLPGAPPVEFVRIRTEGDRITDKPLSEVLGKAFFTKEIEQALLDGSVDLAVHSLKDLATQMPPGLSLGAVLKREDPRDILIARSGRSLDGLPKGSSVGTSSLRRRALIARWRPELKLVDLRGNVPTRIEKLDSGDFDAIVLAAAGVKRLGLEARISAYLPTEHVLPAVAQGAIAIQFRKGDQPTLDWIRPLDDPTSHRAVIAERALLRRLEGGCQIPVGALATVQGNELRLSAIVCSLDGRRSVEGTRVGSLDRGDDLGRSLAEELLELGAAEILAAIRRTEGKAS
ncbi:MAG: hydroxymethylbilane synthase [Acidobacteria bacterium]|nr:hydroxymethylbilane synthase [Acidobacteriota bacterium]